MLIKRSNSDITTHQHYERDTRASYPMCACIYIMYICNIFIWICIDIHNNQYKIIIIYIYIFVGTKSNTPIKWALFMSPTWCLLAKHLTGGCQSCSVFHAQAPNNPCTYLDPTKHWRTGFWMFLGMFLHFFGVSKFAKNAWTFQCFEVNKKYLCFNKDTSWGMWSIWAMEHISEFGPSMLSDFNPSQLPVAKFEVRALHLHLATSNL